MDDTKYIATIYPAQLNGKKTTSGGKEYWEVVGEDKKKYRVYVEGIYNRFSTGKSYDVELSEFSDSFTNEQGKKINYTLYTIHNIASSPELDSKEPIDQAIMGGVQKEYQAEKKIYKKESKTEVEADKPDWDEISFGKTRTQIVNGVLANTGLVEPTDEMEDLIDQWTNIAFYGTRKGKK